jgi:hypothetical protein
MKNKLAKYQNEYIIFLVEVIFLFRIFSESKAKSLSSLSDRNMHFLAAKSILLLIFDGRRVKSITKINELFF